MEVSQYKFTLWKMMSRENFSEFTRFFPQGLNPFKLHGIFKLELDPKIYNMISVGNLKLIQLRKLFNVFKGSLMPGLNNCRQREGSVFEFASLG
jgi:hypothetical protein